MLIVRSNITLLITLHTSLIICQFMNVNGIHTLYRPKEKSQQIKSDGKKKKILSFGKSLSFIVLAILSIRVTQ